MILPSGTVRICPLSQPDASNQVCVGSSEGHEYGGTLATTTVLLSCCGATSRYGNCSSASTTYSSAVGWFICVDQLRPPSCVTLAPPSLASIITFGWSGVIQTMWSSPCGVRTFE